MAITDSGLNAAIHFYFNQSRTRLDFQMAERCDGRKIGRPAIESKPACQVIFLPSIFLQFPFYFSGAGAVVGGCVLAISLKYCRIKSAYSLLGFFWAA